MVNQDISRVRRGAQEKYPDGKQTGRGYMNIFYAGKKTQKGGKNCLDVERTPLVVTNAPSACIAGDHFL